jgi:hypothetical protein
MSLPVEILYWVEYCWRKNERKFELAIKKDIEDDDCRRVRFTIYLTGSNARRSVMTSKREALAGIKAFSEPTK